MIVLGGPHLVLADAGAYNRVAFGYIGKSRYYVRSAQLTFWLLAVLGGAAEGVFTLKLINPFQPAFMLRLFNLRIKLVKQGSDVSVDGQVNLNALAQLTLINIDLGLLRPD